MCPIGSALRSANKAWERSMSRPRPACRSSESREVHARSQTMPVRRPCPFALPGACLLENTQARYLTSNLSSARFLGSRILLRCFHLIERNVESIARVGEPLLRRCLHKKPRAKPRPGPWLECVSSLCISACSLANIGKEE
jgi:hypothetical protein